MIWRVNFFFVVAFFLPVLLHQLAVITDLPWISAIPYAWAALRLTTSGHIWTAKLVVTFALAYELFGDLRVSARTTLLVLTSTALLLLECVSGHALDQSTAMFAVYSVHTLSAGVWCGSLATYALVSKAGPGKSLPLEGARKLSHVAGVAAPIAFLSGILIASKSRALTYPILLHTEYGYWLSAKVALALGMLGIGAYCRFMLLPHIYRQAVQTKFLWAVSVEILTSILLLALAVLLATHPVPSVNA